MFVFVFKMHYIINLLQFILSLASLQKQYENRRYHKRELDHDRINGSFWNYEEKQGETTRIMDGDRVIFTRDESALSVAQTRIQSRLPFLISRCIQHSF